jgi:hypothetical protein
LQSPEGRQDCAPGTGDGAAKPRSSEQELVSTRSSKPAVGTNWHVDLPMRRSVAGSGPCTLAGCRLQPWQSPAPESAAPCCRRRRRVSVENLERPARSKSPGARSLRPGSVAAGRLGATHPPRNQDAPPARRGQARQVSPPSPLTKPSTSVAARKHGVSTAAVYSAAVPVMYRRASSTLVPLRRCHQRSRWVLVPPTSRVTRETLVQRRGYQCSSERGTHRLQNGINKNIVEDEFTRQNFRCTSTRHRVAVSTTHTRRRPCPLLVLSRRNALRACPMP